MSRTVRKAAVLGAGTMGARIAAHLANTGIDCLLLDISSEVVSKLFDAMQKSRPPALFTPEHAGRIRLGNFNDDLAKIADADWVIEAVIEDFDAKRSLLTQVDRHRRPGTLVSSNTSGLPIASLAEGLSKDFRAHWMGTHFFNPPRQMRLVELIPTPETRPDVVEFVRDLCDRVLGKVVVFAKDRPNFIANRIFLFDVMKILKTMQAQGLTIEEVDALTGLLIGRPNTATFRLADFVGVDVCVFVSENLHRLVPDDEQRDVFIPPEFLKKMVEKRWIGDKAGQGFFKRAGKDRLVLDLETFEYRPPRPPDLPGIEAARKIADTRARIRHVVWRDDRAGRFLWEILSDLLLYAAARIPEIADDIASVDTTMRYGFNWELGLFEIWDAIGVADSAWRMQSEGRAIPPLVRKLLDAGDARFYRQEKDRRLHFDIATASHQPVAEPPGVIRPATLREREKLLLSNPGASLLDLGDGVLCMEFHSPNNGINADVVALLRAALEETEAHYEALVISNEGANFSAGPNLQFLLEASCAGRWDDIRRAIESAQQAFLAVCRSQKPVVAAVFGQTLGAGLELALQSTRVQALAESYIGLTQTSFGLIPVCGGWIEMLRRWPENLLKEAFEIIALSKVSSSAAEAARWRYLRADDPITMNRDRLIADAKETALALVRGGYIAPAIASPVPVAGRPGAASLKVMIYLMQQAGYISEHDARVARRLAEVLTGGDLPHAAEVPESYLRDLAREAFLSLLGEAKTQERLESALRDGRPSRN